MFALARMATRNAVRYISRRLSSSGKVLGEEEKAAENVYIKKLEKEKLEKLAQKGPKVEEKPATGSGGSSAGTDATSTSTPSSTSGASTSKGPNYAAIAGGVAVLGALGWYLTGSKKTEEAQK